MKINTLTAGISWEPLQGTRCQHNITFKPKTTIKGQVLADFVAEFTTPEEGVEKSNEKVASQDPEQWTLYVDGSSILRKMALEQDSC